MDSTHHIAQQPEAMLRTLLETAQVLQERIERAMESVGLSWAKYGVLSLLVEAGKPLALSDLATRSSCVRSNMTQLVDRLEADGLVRRVADPSDRRVVRAELTDRGRDAAATGARQWSAVTSAAASTLPAKDQAELTRLLAALARRAFDLPAAL